MTISSTAAEDTSGTADRMSARGQKEFVEDVHRLRLARTSGPRDTRVMVLGAVLAVVGLVVTLLCYTEATGFDDLRDQVQNLILAVFGLGLVVLGSGLYVATALTRFLRLWMLRLVHEQRDQAASARRG